MHYLTHPHGPISNILGECAHLKLAILKIPEGGKPSEGMKRSLRF